MMMQTMDDAWSGMGDHMQWGEFSDPGLSDYMNMSWWDPSMDSSMLQYGHGGEVEVGFEEWMGYDGIEDWGRRAPKFPPPEAPAPIVVEGSEMLEQAMLESQAQQLLFQGGFLRPGATFDMETKLSTLPNEGASSFTGRASKPLGLLATPSPDERPRPKALSSMMDPEVKATQEPVHRTVTPETTAPPTPVSSLSELLSSDLEAPSRPVTPASQTAPGSTLWGEKTGLDVDGVTDAGPGYSLFGSGPWLGAGAPRPSEDAPLSSKAPGAALPPIGTAPAKVRLEDLLCREDTSKAKGDSEDPTRSPPTQPSGPPPGLFLPGSLPPPPGLGLEETVISYKIGKRPPGLELATVAELPEELLPTPLLTPADAAPELPASAPEDKSLESVIVEHTEINGIPCTRAVWRIVQLRGRLKTSLGKPVVSPPFAISGLDDLRLMVTPDAKGTLEGMRGKSKQSHFAKMLSQGPLECTLKVKVPCTSTPVVKFYLTVGSNCRQGPFTCDFMQHTMHGCNDFDCDWLKQMDDEGCLCVGLEIVEISANGQRPA